MTTNAWRLGLDLGSTAAKGALVGPDGAVADCMADSSGLPPGEAARLLSATLLGRNGVEDARVVATGYGRALSGVAGRKITEITCHAKGVKHLHPDARCILDIGGQDAKAIRLGPDGGVEDFAMNDRCAAGTGCFLEVAARRYSLSAGELSAFCSDEPGVGEGVDPFEISSTCVVFAESELVGLNARGTPPVESLRAVHRAIARRVALLLGKVDAGDPIYFTGGTARNETLRRAIEAETGFAVLRSDYAQFTGAIGAALLA